MTHQHAVDTLAAERYLLNEMAELERYDFEEHYFSCADCAEDVRFGAMMRDGVKAGLADSTPNRSLESARSARPRWQVVLPWATAATLAIVAGYQSFVAVPVPRSRVEPQALAPISLRPASRGVTPTVVVAPDGVATLAVALNPVDSVTLTYELSASGGQRVAFGRTTAPDAGAPLLLLVPGSTLSPGEYILVVRGASSGISAGEYRFVVAEPVAPPAPSR